MAEPKSAGLPISGGASHYKQDMKPRQIFLYLAQSGSQYSSASPTNNQPVKCPLTSEPNWVIPVPLSPRRLIPPDIGTYSCGSLWRPIQLPILSLRILVLPCSLTIWKFERGFLD